MFSNRYALIRIVFLIVCYSAILAMSLWFAYLLRFDFAIPETTYAELVRFLTIIVAGKLLVFGIFRQYRGLLSYFSVPDLSQLFYACGFASLVLMGLWYRSEGAYAPPRGVILADFVISLLGLASLRLAFRIIRERFLSSQGRPHQGARRVGIIGAGDVGASLAKELMAKRGLGLSPVVFFDDDRRKWHSWIHDIPVVGPPEQLLDSRLNLELEEVIIAMPSATAKRVGEVVKLLQQARLSFATVPSMDQLATGKVKVSQLRSVEIQDLLGRQPVKLKLENIRQLLQKRVTLVTGAGGSIGSEMARQIALFNPERLLLVDQSEVQLFQIEQELIQLGYGGTILALIADVLDEVRIRQILERYRPEVVFHAAAHKHVPLMESQPAEAIKNNVLGTLRLAELAGQCRVDRFVMISTDKAINPTNVMGATKRLAELYLQALHAQQTTATKYMAVRFGNVLGSSGSVVPTFQRQIATGGPVKVTHPDIMRYFMTIPEAVGLVLQSAAQGQGGEIFVLDMGEPVKILDLARQLIELNGLKPDEDIEIEFVGLRPGEKLFEELSYRGENVQPTDHPKIMRFVTQPLSLEQVQEIVRALTQGMHDIENNQLKLRLQQAVPEYRPFLI